MSQAALKALLAKGAVKEAIQQLLTLTVGNSLHNEVVQQSAHFNDYLKGKRSNTSTMVEQRIAIAKINDSLLQIIDELDTADGEGVSTPPTAANNMPTERPSPDRWKYVVRIGVLVGIMAGVIASLKHCGFIGSDTTNTTNSITVLVHGPGGLGDVPIAGRGIVYLLYGDAKIPEQINDEGEANFMQIDRSFFEEGASVRFVFEDPKGEPYQLRYPDSTYQLTAGQSIKLEALLKGMDTLEGTVKDFVTGDPLDSVLVRIRGNSYYTNEFGEFTLDIPENRQAQFIDITFSKEGYERKELQDVPTTTGRDQTVSLKPL